MKKFKKILTTGCLFAAIASMSIADPVTQLIPANQQQSGQYNYFFNGKSLQAALTEFAKNNGLAINISKSVSPTVLAQKVNGRFTVNQIEDLLNKLSKQYGFNWFFYSGTLYITSNQNVTVKIEVAPQDMEGIRNNLVQMGLYDSRFGYSEMPAEDKVLVTGPREYTDLLMAQINKLNISPVNQQFAVYRLKYANAADMQFNFNNQQIIIPGVATILRGLLQNNQVNSGSGANQISNQVSEMMKNPNPADKSSGANSKATNSTAGGDNKQADNVTNGRGSYPLVEADNRLNTIIIRDKNNNLAIYKNLIETLDVPAPLIQVEVLVFKLDQDKLNQAGINWFLSGAGSSIGFGAGNLNTGTVSNSLSTSFMQLNPGNVMVTNALSFSNSLNYLEQNSYAQTVAKPSIATIDNIPAIVTINKNYFYGTSTTSGQNSGAAYSGMQVTQALQVTPHVIFDGKTRRMKLSIILDDGSIDQISNSAIPSTTQSQINSQALLDEGQSIILAGYTKEVAQETETKVPGLADIPWLGALFRSKSMVNHKEVTLYMVTPKIIWERDTYKLGNYISVGKKQVDIQDNYKVSTVAESGVTKTP